VSAGGVLPMCQDTGTAIVMGKKARRYGPAAATNRRSPRASTRPTRDHLRYSQVSPISMFKEVQTGTPAAQIDIYATDGDATSPVHCQGRRLGNKKLSLQQTPARAERAALLKFSTRRSARWAPRCPPYHLAIVIGGTSAEMNLKTVELASTRYLDDLPGEGNDKGVAIRDRGMEKKVLELTRQMGIGAQFAASTSATTWRVIRIARHGASVPSAWA